MGFLRQDSDADRSGATEGPSLTRHVEQRQAADPDTGQAASDAIRKLQDFRGTQSEGNLRAFETATNGRKDRGMQGRLVKLLIRLSVSHSQPNEGGVPDELEREGRATETCCHDACRSETLIKALYLYEPPKKREPRRLLLRRAFSELRERRRQRRAARKPGALGAKHKDEDKDEDKGEDKGEDECALFADTVDAEGAQSDSEFSEASVFSSFTDRDGSPTHSTDLGDETSCENGPSPITKTGLSTTGLKHCENNEAARENEVENDEEKVFVPKLLGELVNFVTTCYEEQNCCRLKLQDDLESTTPLIEVRGLSHPPPRLSVPLPKNSSIEARTGSARTTTSATRDADDNDDDNDEDWENISAIFRMSSQDVKFLLTDSQLFNFIMPSPSQADLHGSTNSLVDPRKPGMGSITESTLQMEGAREEMPKTLLVRLNLECCPFQSLRTKFAGYNFATHFSFARWSVSRWKMRFRKFFAALRLGNPEIRQLWRSGVYSPRYLNDQLADVQNFFDRAVREGFT